MTLLDHLRAHLAGLGLVRPPRVAGAAPPLYLNPEKGAPAPGDRTLEEFDAAAVLSAFDGVETPTGPYGSWRYQPAVDFRLRVVRPARAHEISAALREALHDRRGWVTSSGLQVIESMQARGLSPLGSDQGVYTYSTGYDFELYA